MDTLLAGDEVSVRKADSTIEAVTVRQLPLKDYKKGFLINDEEFATVALICGKAESWVYELTPESFDILRVKAEEVNKSFFDYCGRERSKLYDRLNMLKPEVAQAVKASMSGLPASVPRPQ